MAAPANSYQRTDITHELEDIRDVVDDVSPWMTPFYANAEKTQVENTHYEFHTDELDAATTDNAWIDGNEFAPSAITPTVRLSNHCQIQRKDFLVTRRARRINKAGQRDELARQVTRKGLELRRDMESTLLNNQIKVADNGSVAPKLAGLPTWILAANATADAGRGQYGTGGNGNSAEANLSSTLKVDGTKRAASEGTMLVVVEAIYNESSELPDMVLLDPRSKRNFSNYMFGSSARIATQYQNQGRSPRGGVQVVGAVDVWVSDFATLDIVPDIFLPNRLEGTGYDWFIYNSSYAQCAMFDPMSTDAMGRRGDTFDRIIVVDHTLVIKNPRAFGTLADVDETKAMVA